MSQLPPLPSWQQSPNYSFLIRSGIYDRRKNGGTSGVVPLGYQVIWENHQSHLHVDTGVAPFIQQLFQRAGDPEQSLRGLFRDMNEQGMRSRNDNLISSSGFYVILQNPYYAGFVKDETGTFVQGKHEPIVTLEMFNAVQRRMHRDEVSSNIEKTAHEMDSGAVFG